MLHDLYRFSAYTESFLLNFPDVEFRLGYYQASAQFHEKLVLRKALALSGLYLTDGRCYFTKLLSRLSYPRGRKDQIPVSLIAGLVRASYV